MNHKAHIATRKPLVRLGIALAIVLGASSCETIKPVEEPAPSSRPVKVEDPRIRILLAQAEQALFNDQLTTPLDDNAYYRYLQVLSIDIDNELAEQGIANIVETYLAWSIQKIESRQFRRATDFLNKARSVDENHPNIASVENMLKSQVQGTSLSFSLSRLEVQQKSVSSVASLQSIAQDIARLHASIIIEAPTDEMGRWIYQQLNEASLERVRAQFELTNRVRIHLSY
ncbi:MAG: hypothetical protein VB957_07230 [Pseudomonadales bacterium]